MDMILFPKSKCFETIVGNSIMAKTISLADEILALKLIINDHKIPSNAIKKTTALKRLLAINTALEESLAQPGNKLDVNVPPINLKTKE